MQLHRRQPPGDCNPSLLHATLRAHADSCVTFFFVCFVSSNLMDVIMVIIISRLHHEWIVFIYGCLTN